MKSIRWKLVFMYVSLVFLVMVVCGTFMVVRLQQRERERAERDLSAFANLIRSNVVEAICPPDSVGFEVTYSTFQETLYNLARDDAETECYIIRLAAYNKPTIATTTAAEPPFPQFETSVIIAAADGGDAFNYNRKLTDAMGEHVKAWYEYASGYRTDDGSVNLVIYVRRDATQSDENVRQVIYIFALSVALALMFTVILGFVFSNSLTAPLSALSKGAAELAAGNLRKRIDVRTRDEIGQLSGRFNIMAETLTGMISHMEGEKNKIEILLNNVTDGVLAYDVTGRLLHANEACSELLEGLDVRELSFEGLLGLLGIKTDGGGALETAAELNESGEYSLTVSDKYLTLSFNLYKNNEGAEGVVIVVQDVTRHMKLDNVRKAFVADVSHELRTPLTTIKNYAETLDDPDIVIDGEKRSEFLKVIVSETDRMTHIVADLLELSRFDNNKFNLSIADVDLRDLAAQCVKRNALNAEKMKKRVLCGGADKPVVVAADANRVGQVLNNIVSNSLKYSNEGATVDIRVSDGEDFAKLFVKDDGMGIPKEDLRHIFDRFYRVDKARSRELGGTGLGLSIAKEIMEAHGGSISAASELGKGTTMTLTFPKRIKS